MFESVTSLVIASLLLIASDVDTQLAKWRPVKMPLDRSHLSPRELLLVEKLVETSRDLEVIYWLQSDPQGLELYRTTKDPALKRALMINGGRFDLLDDNKPFVGTEPISAGRNLYPAGLTRTRIEAYVNVHPTQKEAIYNPYTIVRRQGEHLTTEPYHSAYRTYLERAARALRQASELSDEGDFSLFLRLRADALLSDDYYPSDLLWVDLKNPKFDIILGPYETYLDDVLGVKTSYSAAVLIRNEAESQKLSLYQKYVPDIQDALPLDVADRPSKKGQPSPMEVADSPFRTGDLRHGYQAVADNLPNDPRIHQAKGTKKIFFKNFMDARVNYVVLPVAKQLMQPDQAAKASGDGYLAAVILHEICHGLGPAYSRKGEQKIGIREAIGPAYSGLEEAKADVVGMFGLQWLMDHGVLPKERSEEFYSSFMAGIFRTARYGIAEAHGRAEMMEFNFLTEEKAIRQEGGRYAIDYAAMPPALAKLAKELLEIEATGDRPRAEAWFEKYGKMPADLAAALKSVTGVPVDIDPIFDFPELTQK